MDDMTCVSRVSMLDEIDMRELSRTSIELEYSLPRMAVLVW